MVSIDLWRYELDFLEITAIGTSPDEIKSLYPWLRNQGFTSKDFNKYAFYTMDRLILRHYMRKNRWSNRKREIDVFDNVHVKFNPPSFMDLVRQVKDFENRRIGDLHLIVTKYPDPRGWLLPRKIMEPLAAKPWDAYALLIQKDDDEYRTEHNPKNNCYIENGEQLRVH